MNSDSRGFTLLEAMLATALFTFAVLGLLQALNLASRATHEAAELTEIHRYMRSIVTNETRLPEIELGEKSFGDFLPGIEFVSLIEEADLQSNSGKTLAPLFRVTVEAYRQSPGNREQLSRVSTLVYPPLVKGSGN